MATFPNQRRFAYEYGQRWAVRLPRRDLRTFVSHIHCAEPEDKVLAESARSASAAGICKAPTSG